MVPGFLLVSRLTLVSLSPWTLKAPSVHVSHTNLAYLFSTCLHVPEVYCGGVAPPATSCYCLHLRRSHSALWLLMSESQLQATHICIGSLQVSRIHFRHVVWWLCIPPVKILGGVLIRSSARRIFRLCFSSPSIANRTYLPTYLRAHAERQTSSCEIYFFTYALRHEQFPPPFVGGKARRDTHTSEKMLRWLSL